ncbi:Pentatricopeptide repeat [Macleaya cordata]|uniref:Pentatricopeptide repeat n=1 Tax=Macleaya cordata TaxID=56857 RepID=A0A200PPE8_MACCD|nr:Pentatricopeptide repeat [Macleaya cordata]
MDYASKIVEQIENPNVFLYTALMEGHILSGSYVDAIQSYNQMINESIGADTYAIASVLKACGSQLALKEGQQIHSQVLKLQLGSNRSIQIKLIELYGKCGEFEDARRVSDKMPEGDVATSTIMISSYLDHGFIEEASAIFDRVQFKDTVCWTAMINGLVHSGEMNKALDLFRKMQRENVRPNEVTIVCVLSACSQLGALELGKWVHSYVDKYKIKLNHFVGSALIGMYSKCGSLDEAKQVFSKMEDRDVVTYNSMLVGFASHGKSSEAIEVFREMVKNGLKLNQRTFVGVLNACSHGGLVDLGFQIFRSMKKDHGIEPRIEHYGCMVDLLGRLGWLEEAYNFIKTMEIEPDYIIWGSLLSACKIHGNLKLGEEGTSASSSYP